MLSDNIRDQIIIDTVVTESWLNALADIGMNLRLNSLPFRPVVYEEETALQIPGGNLLVSTKVNGMQADMVVPATHWRMENLNR